MAEYKILTKQTYINGKYSLKPIRMEDRYNILKWRNEQMYHLRQNMPLTKEKQDIYFDSVLTKLFEQNNPSQILFSYFNGKECIGYGGLVHINWIDKNAEISFIMNTELENEFFETHWMNFLHLIEEVAFRELNLHKIFTYAFDLRPKLYTALEKSGFGLDAELKDHSFFENKFIDVKIHSKFNKENVLRPARYSDLNLTFNWANMASIRAFSFNKDKISLKEHSDWYFKKLDNLSCEYYILEVNGNPAGSIRFDLDGEKLAKINYLLDPNFTGKGFGTYLLENGLKFLKKNRPAIQKAYGFVLKDNIASVRIFEKLAFKKVSEKSSELKFEKIL